jgi:hypothetical protein
MKKLLNILYEISLSIGQARAAAAAVREGRYDLARDLIK